MAHTNLSQSAYGNSLYSGSPQATSRLMQSYQQTPSNLYFDMYSHETPSHLSLRHPSPLPKIECPSPPSRGSPTMQSANHSPDHHLSAPHIVNIGGNSSPNDKLIIDAHLERPTVVSISSSS